MNILRFFVTNWDSVAIVLAAVVAVVALIVKKRWKALDTVLFGLVTWAERTYGGGTGALKLAEVLQRLYPQIPAVIRVFVGEGRLEGLIDEALEKAKEKWKGNPRLVG